MASVGRVLEPWDGSNQLCLALGTYSQRYYTRTSADPAEFPAFPPPTFAPTWQAGMSGQHAAADAVPSPTLVGEGSVDYTHVCIMVGHDDDVVLDPRAPAPYRNRESRWAGLQSDIAIVEAIKGRFPRLSIDIAYTIEELLSKAAKARTLCYA